MSLQEEIDKKAKEIHTDSYPMSIGELASLYKDEELDIHPEFQRFYRWETYQKSKFIESIFLGIPIPSIFVSQRDDGVWDVVDGLQRLSTIFEFMGLLKDDEKNFLPPSVLMKTKYLPSLEGKMWDDPNNPENSLTQAQRMFIKRSKLDINIVKKESDSSIKYELFQRINSLGSKLSDQEMRNCILIMANRDFYIWFDDLSKYEPFLKCLELSKRLMCEKYHQEILSRYLVFMRLDVEKLRAAESLAELLTDTLIDYGDSQDFDYNYEKRRFRMTFELLYNTLNSDSFKKYNSQKNKFEGPFLISSFEAIAIGVAKNFDTWSQHGLDYDELKEVMVNKAKNLWSNKEFLENIGSGRKYDTRVPIVVPIGIELFADL